MPAARNNSFDRPEPDSWIVAPSCRLAASHDGRGTGSEYFSTLADHGIRGGGKAVGTVGTVTLVDQSKSNVRSPDAEAVRSLDASFGDTISEEFGIEPAGSRAKPRQHHRRAEGGNGTDTVADYSGTPDIEALLTGANKPADELETTNG